MPKSGGKQFQRCLKKFVVGTWNTYGGCHFSKQMFFCYIIDSNGHFLLWPIVVSIKSCLLKWYPVHISHFSTSSTILCRSIIFSLNIVLFPHIATIFIKVAIIFGFLMIQVNCRQLRSQCQRMWSSFKIPCTSDLGGQSTWRKLYSASNYPLFM